MDNTTKFLKRAIELSIRSMNEGRFPAGAVIVKNDEIIAESVSGLWPAINHHGEADVVDMAMSKNNERLNEYTVYSSMEPCLMCIGKAYWAGLNKMVFAIEKKKLTAGSYEGDYSNDQILQVLDREIELIHFPDLEQEAVNAIVTSKLVTFK